MTVSKKDIEQYVALLDDIHVLGIEIEFAERKKAELETKKEDIAAKLRDTVGRNINKKMYKTDSDVCVLVEYQGELPSVAKQSKPIRRPPTITVLTPEDYPRENGT